MLATTAQIEEVDLERLQDLTLGAAEYRNFDKIQDICRELIVSDEDLRKFMRSMDDCMEQGLRKETAASANVRMLPSYVRAVPNGREQGDYLALDLGGTNFRVLLIRLQGREAEMSGHIYRVPDEIMKGTGVALFDHIAKCLAEFIDGQNLKGRRLPLGFTFSFPCQQEGLARAKLLNWTKGFNASGVEGEDVVRLLNEACARRGDINVDVAAFLNDSVGTLMACAFEENTCEVAVIAGTGTNACYMEKLSKATKLHDEIDVNDGQPDEMIIVTEWGTFGDRGEMDFIRTEYDDVVDEMSINQSRQKYEKMISGMFLGEVARLVLLKLAEEGLLFAGHTAALQNYGCFPTKFLSEIESDLMDEDAEPPLQKTMQILEDLGAASPTLQDCQDVAYVCRLVGTRAAHLTAAGIATILNRMGKDFVTVGIDGSVYRFHPTFGKLLERKIADLVDGGRKFQIMLSEDGSGKGAALVAAVATRTSTR